MEGSMERWLAFAGFSSNPFALHEAGKENLLPHYFVPSPCFDDIVGDPLSPMSTVVFAARGSGKTAQRRMIHRLCRERQLGRGSALGVIYTDFERVAALTSELPPNDLVHAHVVEILHHVVSSLADAFIADEQVFFRYSEQSRWEKIHLHRYIYQFNRELTPFQRGELARIGIKPLTPDTTSAQDCLGEDLTEYFEDFDKNAQTYPTSLMLQISSLIKGLGFDAIYVLVDGVDELAATARDTESAICLLSPILQHLSLLDLPGLSFKFFLPIEWSEELMNRGIIRKDRLRVRYADWTPSQLVEMLRRRIRAFRNKGHIQDLCEPNLADCIEAEMTRLSIGSPRNLIRLGNILFSEHCDSFNGSVQRKIPLTVWERAKSRFLESRDTVCTGNYGRRSGRNGGHNAFFPPC